MVVSAHLAMIVQTAAKAAALAENVVVIASARMTAPNASSKPEGLILQLNCIARTL